VGVVLVVAMLITPGATALLLCERMGTMLVVSPVLAGACAVGGLYASFFLDTSSAGTVVVAQGLVFAAAYLFAPRRGLVAVRRRRRRGVAARAAAVGPSADPVAVVASRPAPPAASREGVR
jgi:manganese transport system permease protein